MACLYFLCARSEKCSWRPGHANFLDELIEEFHIDDESANPKYQKAAPKIAHSAASKQQKQEIQEDDDGESTASDDWSEYDSDDDEDHALVRTQSGRLHRVEVDAQEEDDSSDGEEIYGMMPALIKDVGSNASSADTSPASISEGTEDYFTQIAHAPVLAGDETAKHVEKVDVEIASPMSTR